MFSSSQNATSSTADPFAESLPTNLRFPKNVNSDSFNMKSKEISNIDQWLSGSDASFVAPQSPANIDSKKRKFSDESTYSNTLHRLRAHRFPLTKTGYKYLEIGINIMKPSKVEIAIGDNQGKEIILNYEMWKNIIENEETIFNFFRRNEERLTSHLIPVGYLTLRFGKINNLPILRMETSNLRMVLSKDTVSKMINHKFIIKNIYGTLNCEIATLDPKLERFYALIAAAKDMNAAKVAIRNDSSFDENNKVDGELYSRLFD